MNENNLSTKLLTVQNTVSGMKDDLDLPEEATLQQVESAIIPEGERLIISEYSQDGNVKTLILKNMTTFPADLFEFTWSLPPQQTDPFIDLETIILSNNFTTLPNKYACFGNSKLKNFNIEDTQIQVIPQGFFCAAKNLILKTLPESLVEIKNSAFCDCISPQLSMPGIQIIGEYLFERASTKALWIGSSITEIKQYAFYYGVSLQKIYIDLPRATVEAMPYYEIKWSGDTASTKTNAQIICNDDEDWITQEEFDATDWSTYAE